MATNEHALSITIRNKEIPLARAMLRQRDLEFYPRNPRVHSLVWQGDKEPSQEDIQETLGAMDHVKQLVQSIRANGGLIDPLLVRNDGNIVLEGNSRLAAYRLLEKQDAVRWANVKCDVVTVAISEDEVFSLLTNYHIVGRKDWAPYEQAGIFWRRFHKDGASEKELAKEVKDLGLSEYRVRNMIAVYDFMIKHNDASPSRWSYYDELLKSQPIQKVRKENPKFDKVIVGKIRSGEIARADDIRKKVHKIAKTGGKTLNRFINKKASVDDCYDKVISQGANNVLLQRIRRFRTLASDPDIRSELLKMPENQQTKCIFELKKIRNASDKWIKLLTKST